MWVHRSRRSNGISDDQIDDRPRARFELVDSGHDHFVESAGLLLDETRDLAIGRGFSERLKRERQRDAGEDADGGDDEDERDAFLRNQEHREQPDQQHAGGRPRADRPRAQERAPRPSRPHGGENGLKFARSIGHR